jgi:hypothetical protein
VVTNSALLQCFLLFHYICTLLGYYAAKSGNSLRAFQDKLLVPSCWPLKMGPIGCPKLSVKNYHSLLHNTPEECRSHLYCRSLKSCIVMYISNCVAEGGRGAADMACSAWWLHDRDSSTQGLGQDWFTHMKTLAALLFLIQLCNGRWQFLLLAINVTETVHL